jgi:cytochrome P450
MGLAQAFSRYSDIVGAAADGETFSSETGGNRQGGGTTLEDMPTGALAGVLLNMMDDPRHAQFRRLLIPSMAPRLLQRIEADLRKRAADIIEAALAKRDCDFLVDVAAELPLQAVAQLVGVPQQDRHELMNWANVTLDYEDREVVETTECLAQASARMFEYGSTLLAHKRTHPPEDLLSVVTHAEIDGEPLTEAEQRMFFSLMIAAGSETTRNSIAVGMLAMMQTPDAWHRLHEDRSMLPTAVEELLRWASSTPYNRRTPTRDVFFGGQTIKAGDTVTLWWASANRDETVFVDPYTFDITRNPNPHLAFGRGGHFCLGAALARMEMRVMFDALLDWWRHAHRAGGVCPQQQTCRRPSHARAA